MFNCSLSAYANKHYFILNVYLFFMNIYLVRYVYNSFVVRNSRLSKRSPRQLRGALFRRKSLLLITFDHLIIGRSTRSAHHRRHGWYTRSHANPTRKYTQCVHIPNIFKTNKTLIIYFWRNHCRTLGIPNTSYLCVALYFLFSGGAVEEYKK